MLLLPVSIISSFFVLAWSSQPAKVHSSKDIPRKEIPHEIECAVRYHSLPVPEDSSQEDINVVNGLPPSAQPTNPPEPNHRCECVPYYLCNRNKTIAQDGDGLVDMRVSLLSGVGLVSTPPYAPCSCINSTSVSKPNSSGVCSNYLDVCCGPPQQPSNQLGPPPTLTGCGRRGSAGGLDLRLPPGYGRPGAQYAEFPWMVAILGESIIDGKKEREVYLCGGSLIDPNVVLTAAHCVKGVPNLTVRAGEYDSQADSELHPTQERRVHHMTVHEGFYAGTLFNDIALLFLDNPVTLAPNVGIICLPQQGENMDERTCVASGWGKDVFGEEGRYQVTLKKVELPVLPRTTCDRLFRSTRLGRYFRLHESFICAGGVTGQDTCKGDGGSPLVCPSLDNPEVFVQAGIVSWGIGCGGETPGAYVNVPHFRTWIDSNTAMLTVDNRLGSLKRR